MGNVLLWPKFNKKTIWNIYIIFVHWLSLILSVKRFFPQYADLVYTYLQYPLKIKNN